MTDPIADMLTRIRNAYTIGREVVFIESSKLKIAILTILKEQGYVEDFKKDENRIEINLRYDNKGPAVTKMERVSKPGHRVYVKKNEIPSVLSGRGITLISTPKGVMTGDKAKENKLGGELICKVY